MNEPRLKLANAPIVEAVIDIDCDMPPGFDLATMEKPAQEAFADRYPKFQKQLIQEHQFETKADAQPKMSTRNAINALQFLQENGEQLVQVRTGGFSFNRLKPYKSLDEYLPEIERTWRLFLGLASPIQIKVVRLRYINRILLPTVVGDVELNDYLKIGPRLPDENKLKLVGFLNQHAVVETDTGNQATIVMTSQVHENDKLPIIFDNCVANAGTGVPTDWPWILAKIVSLRDLKNRIFQDSLTEKCLKLFQQ